MLFESFDFWDESFWLPANVTWADMEMVRGKHQNNVLFQDFVYPWVAAIIITLIRNFLKRKIFLPLGVYLQVKDTTEKAELNALLEETYKKSSHINNEKILRLAKQSDWPKKRVSRWWKIRTQENNPSELFRFCERAVDGLFYVSNFIYASLILWNKHWIWDQTKFFIDIPYQVETELWLYYFITMSFYWSVLFDIIKNHKINDFLDFFLHHVTTILLLIMSRISNTYRPGCLIIITHDCADIFLEYAKMARYASYHKVSNALLAFYTMVWVITRLYIFPFHIILRTFLWAPVTFPAFRIFTYILVALLFIHIYWTNQILRVFYRVFFVNENESKLQSKLEHQKTKPVTKDQ